MRTKVTFVSDPNFEDVDKRLFVQKKLPLKFTSKKKAVTFGEPQILNLEEFYWQA